MKASAVTQHPRRDGEMVPATVTTEVDILVQRKRATDRPPKAFPMTDTDNISIRSALCSSSLPDRRRARPARTNLRCCSPSRPSRRPPLLKALASGPMRHALKGMSPEVDVCRNMPLSRYFLASRTLCRRATGLPAVESAFEVHVARRLQIFQVMKAMRARSPASEPHCSGKYHHDVGELPPVPMPGGSASVHA